MQLGNIFDSTHTSATAPSGWTGKFFHLGDNKEVFDAEVYAIAQALSVMDQRRGSGRRYTVFVDSTSAIGRVRSDSIGRARALQ